MAADVCRVLDLYLKMDGTVNVWDAMRCLGADQHQLHISPSQRGGKLTVISESGLYKLILRSDKPEANPFQD